MEKKLEESMNWLGFQTGLRKIIAIPMLPSHVTVFHIDFGVVLEVPIGHRF